MIRFVPMSKGRTEKKSTPPGLTGDGVRKYFQLKEIAGSGGLL
jgi:hypothetical protein